MDVEAMVFRLQLAGQVDFGTGDVAVNIHPAGHDHHPGGVDPPGLWGYARDDLAILDADIAHFAINAVDRVVNSAIDDTECR
jgi:hypothetical protein